jgi:5-methylcytosine-specific restriction endonuclease McrA
MTTDPLTGTLAILLLLVLIFWPWLMTRRRRSKRDDRTWREKYHAYLNSPAWKNKRQELFQKRGYRCEGEGCGSTVGLQVHHLTYRNLGHESLRDLKILCPSCHAREDVKRARKNQPWRYA